jgi:F-type H+-transporting ATPase subunit delta
MLRGASAEARDDLVSRLEGLSGDAATLGEELFAIAAVLRGEAAVRRIATDASIEGAAKAGLMGNVFGNALGSDAVDLVKDAVKRRWTRPRDLADVIEYLGVLATVRSAGDEGGRISDELFEVRRTVDGYGDLRSALSDPARTAEDKRGLLHQLFDGKVKPATLVLVGQAVSGSHGSVDRGLEEFQHVAAEAKNEKMATVRTARPLADAEVERLTQALSDQYATSVHLQVVVDPDVVGGLRVEIGDDVIDGTVSSKLDDAQRKLAG